jgi:hypothetical protein
MGRANRKHRLAALISTLGSAITLTMITPGTASAQPNSRLCGASWKSVSSGEIVTRIYEVPKTEVTKQCTLANGSDVGVWHSPFGNRLKDKDRADWARFTVNVQKTVWSARFGWHHESQPVPSVFRFEYCEEWRDRPAELGGLAGRDLNFIGDNWPRQRSQADICLNMNKSDWVADMERYWLYDDNNPATPGVDFQRG